MQTADKLHDANSNAVRAAWAFIRRLGRASNDKRITFCDASYDTDRLGQPP